MSIKNLIKKALGNSSGEPSDSHAPLSGSDKRVFVKRENRLDVLPLHNLSLHLREPNHHSPLPIANISFGGMGMIAVGVRGIDSSKQVLKGTLNLSQKEIPVELRVAYFKSPSLGCEFIEPSPELKKTIQSYFDLELKALEMREIKELANDAEGMPHWFLGDNNCELYFVEKNQKLQSFRISFFGNSIEYQATQPLRFGYAVEDGNSDRAWRAGDEVLPRAIKFVSNIAALDAGIKKDIRSILTS